MKIIKSNFGQDAEGWVVTADRDKFGWQDHGGNPGGYLAWSDKASGEDAYFQAPAAYTGDLHTYYGTVLSYDIRDTGSDYDGVPDVEISGANGVTLVATVAQAGTKWTHLSIELAAGQGWHVGSLDGADAMKADFKGVLADVSQLLIRAEYVTGKEQGGLDNVSLGKAPPASLDGASEPLFHSETHLFDGLQGHHFQIA